MDEDFRREALDYHRLPQPGKLAIEPTKRLFSQRDLALAYSPGVAAACEEIAADPSTARDYTARGNLVAVITNGTAVLGLGNIGPLAAKPVMEGKAVLFKKFAGIDVFDLEIEQPDADKFIETVASLEPTFGAINLEDIKAPECFYIEQALRDRMSIPVFHDDQHGTAIVCAAAVVNALALSGKELAHIKLVTSGAGAAALACVDLLVAIGLPVDNVTLTDIDGVVHIDRNDAMPPNMARYARKTNARTLEEALADADVFLGLSAPRVLAPEWLAVMAPCPLIMALANPDPEILPELVNLHRPDAIVATGRSDYGNQVNNVLCFPFIFRGALDVGATEVNDAMKIAAVKAIAELARSPASDVVVTAYGGETPVFGTDYIIPRPFDPRLMLYVAPAVAQAAINSGVATRPIADFDAYRRQLEVFVYRSGQLMRPIFAKAQSDPRKVALAEGSDDRVLRAAQTMIDESIAMPVLIGSRAAIRQRIDCLGLRLREAENIEIFDPHLDHERTAVLLGEYQRLAGRRGAPPASAERQLLTRPTIAASMLLRSGAVDAALCGGVDDWWHHLTEVVSLISRQPGITRLYALSAVILPHGALFLADTHLNVDPTAEQIVEMTVLAAQEIRRFGIIPRAALVSHSNFGASNSPTARKMRTAAAMLKQRELDFEIDGEMHADVALSAAMRERVVADSTLTGSANLLIMPGLDAAKIGATLLAAATDAMPLGPIIMGLSRPLHILSPNVTARAIVNMAAISASQAIGSAVSPLTP